MLQQVAMCATDAAAQHVVVDCRAAAEASSIAAEAAARGAGYGVDACAIHTVLPPGQRSHLVSPE